jgi:hypothetical protein
MKKAFEATMQLAYDRDYENVSFDEVGVDFGHFQSMFRKITEGDFSEAKLGRWLGYLQGVLVANQCLTLEECKALNAQYADDWTHLHLGRGTRYKVIGEARAQCNDVPVKDGDMLVLYRGEDGIYSVRPPEEFNDGRFEALV